MGNKCSLCMNCKFKETDNTMPPCNFCEDCSSFRLRPPKQGPDSICKTCKYRLWPRINGYCSTCNAYGSSYVHYPIKENWISDFVDSVVGFDLPTVKIEKIIFSGPATIILWKDGNKTIVKYHKEKGCAYRKDLGVLYCIIKHYLCLDNEKLFHKFLKTIDGYCEAENGDKTT